MLISAAHSLTVDATASSSQQRLESRLQPIDASHIRANLEAFASRATFDSYLETYSDIDLLRLHNAYGAFANRPAGVEETPQNSLESVESTTGRSTRVYEELLPELIAQTRLEDLDAPTERHNEIAEHDLGEALNSVQSQFSSYAGALSALETLREVSAPLLDGRFPLSDTRPFLETTRAAFDVFFGHDYQGGHVGAQREAARHVFHEQAVSQLTRAAAETKRAQVAVEIVSRAREEYEGLFRSNEDYAFADKAGRAFRLLSALELAAATLLYRTAEIESRVRDFDSELKSLEADYWTALHETKRVWSRIDAALA